MSFFLFSFFVGHKCIFRSLTFINRMFPSFFISISYIIKSANFLSVTICALLLFIPAPLFHPTALLFFLLFFPLKKQPTWDLLDKNLLLLLPMFVLWPTRMFSFLFCTFRNNMLFSPVLPLPLSTEKLSDTCTYVMYVCVSNTFVCIIVAADKSL